MGAWFYHSLLVKPQNILWSWFHGNEIIDTGMPWKSLCFLAQKTHTIFQSEGIHLAPLCYSQLLSEPLTQGPLWGGLSWRTSPLGQIKFISKPVKMQLFVNNAARDQPGSKKNYPSCLTCGVWKCCSPMLALSPAPWENCSRCYNSKEMFSFISVWLVVSSSWIGIEPGTEPHLTIFRALCVDELIQGLQHAIFRAHFLFKRKYLLEIQELYINWKIILKRQGTHKVLCHRGWEMGVIGEIKHRPPMQKTVLWSDLWMNPGKGNKQEIRMVCRSWIHRRAQPRDSC